MNNKLVFLPSSQEPQPGNSAQILMRTKAPLGDLMSSVTGLGQLNPEIAFHFHVFKSQIRDSLMRERLMATLSGFFGVLAVALSCIGLYGVMSYGVASRTSEIGIRMALGARPGDVLWLILREALLMVLVGVAIGVPAVLGSAQLVSAMLFGLKPTDPLSLMLASLLMVAVAVVAGYIPARRATKVDPIVALRYE